MGQHLQYLYQDEWVTECSIWRPSTRPPTPDVITLRDEAGVAISSSAMTTMLMTLYDLTGGANAVVNSIVNFEVKNVLPRGALSSLGVFTLTLQKEDTQILVATHHYELRRAIIRYTWASGVKADTLIITFVVRNTTPEIVP